MFEIATMEPALIKTLLGEDELRKLRGHFDEEVLRDMARELGKKLPDSKWFVDGILEQFYRPEAYASPEDYKRAAFQRESQLITLFMVFSRGEGLFLGVHFYWGLMMGLSPEDLARCIMLVAAYGGIQLLNAGLTTLERTLELLKRLARSEEHPTPGVVVRELAR
jgi:alkylhydroperoxidase/carboxymuconolactone decarboxylase family protein YurZ